MPAIAADTAVMTKAHPTSVGPRSRRARPRIQGLSGLLPATLSDRRAGGDTTRDQARRTQLHPGRGRQEHTELVAVMQALHPLAPPRPPGSSVAFALSAPGVLEDLVTRSGLPPMETEYIQLPYEYPDQATMLRAQCSSAPAVLAARTSGKTNVKGAIRSAMPPYRTESGGYRIQTEYRYLTATA